MVGRRQAESVAQQHVHLRANLVDGRLRAERGRVGAAVGLHAQAAGAGGACAVTQGAHQAVHVGLLVRLRFALEKKDKSLSSETARGQNKPRSVDVLQWTS